MAGELKKVINVEEYRALKKEDKAKYKVYMPTTDPVIGAQMDLANAETKALSYLKPLHDKIAAMPVDLPGKQLKEAVETLEIMISLLDPIKALMNVPIIGTLVKPLVNFLNSLIQIIGSLFFLIGCILQGKDILTDSICKTINDIKWDELTDAMETIKLKKQAVEKAKKEKEEEDAKKTKEQLEAEADERKKKIEEEKKKIREAIKKELGKDYDEFSEQVVKMVDNLELGVQYAKIMKAMKLQLQQYSWSEGTIKEIIKKVLGSIGVDLSPLDQMTAEQQKKFNSLFPDPTSAINKANSVIEKMNKNTKYVLIVESEKEEQNKK